MMNNEEDAALQAELAEARAMLEKCGDQMLKQLELSPEDLAALEESLGQQSKLFGPNTELSYQRMLRDIKESGNGD